MREFWREGWQRLRAVRNSRAAADPRRNSAARGESLASVTIAAFREGLPVTAVKMQRPDLRHQRRGSGRSRPRSLLHGTADDQKRADTSLPALLRRHARSARPATRAGSRPLRYLQAQMTTRARAPGRRMDPERPQDLGHERPRRRSVRLLRAAARRTPPRRVLGIHAFIIPCATRARPARRSRNQEARPADPFPMGEIAFEDCRGSGAGNALLGREGRGAEVFQASMEWEPRARTWRGRSARCGAKLGLLHRTRREPEQAVRQADRMRNQGRQANRIVEMSLRLETVPPLKFTRSAGFKEQGKDAGIQAAMAKAARSPSASCRTALTPSRSSGPPATAPSLGSSAS